jgi:hypothetical protein
MIQYTAADNCLHCPKLQKVLYLLGTYYNIFVIVDCSSSSSSNNKEDEEIAAGPPLPLQREFIQQIRSKLLNMDQHELHPTTTTTTTGTTTTEYQLNSHILPRHRIVVTTTSIGRVAFVRQLANTELVITYPDNNDNTNDDNNNNNTSSSSVISELERFGFRTLIYPTTNTNTTSNCYSALGNFLIP